MVLTHYEVRLILREVRDNRLGLVMPGDYGPATIGHLLREGHLTAGYGPGQFILTHKGWLEGQQ